MSADIDRSKVEALDLAERRALIQPLADAYNRIDAAKDGWQTEAFSKRASQQLHHWTIRCCLESRAGCCWT